MNILTLSAAVPGADDPKADSPLFPTSLFATNPVEQMDVQTIQIGGAPALIVDNVYRNPVAVRRFALSLQYSSRGYYPGGYAEVSISPREILLQVNRLLHAQLGRSLALHPHYRGTTFGCIWTDPGDLDPQQRQPHYDYFCDYAGVLYLGPRDGSGGGTTFWRHRATGMSAAPRLLNDLIVRGEGELDAAMRTMGVEDLEALSPAFFSSGLEHVADGYPLDSTPAWDLVDKIESRFNRLVIFYANAFHAPYVEGVPVPPGVYERQRLTQNLFFEFVAPRPSRAE